LSDNTLINELPDIKIVGQDNGQKGLGMALIGYARVSTAEQDTALQTDALSKAADESTICFHKDLRNASKN
jgi:hypothetical protein